MLKNILWILLCLGISFFAIAGNPSGPVKKNTFTVPAEKVLEKFNQGVFSLMPSGFIENKGQIKKQTAKAFLKQNLYSNTGTPKFFCSIRVLLISSAKPTILMVIWNCLKIKMEIKMNWKY